MIAAFTPCRLAGTIEAPPSKSMAHRYLIAAALSGQPCTLSGVDLSEDISATLDCLKALGAEITADGSNITVCPGNFMHWEPSVLPCRESGSTLRFFIPLALCMGLPVTLTGSQRLLERPLTVYEELCRENGFSFHKNFDGVTVCGSLEGGDYTLRGDISSQFITGMLFALTYLGKESSVHITEPFESRSYILLTVSALRAFGADIAFTDENTVAIRPSKLRAFSGRIEGDYSNAAFLAAFNLLGSDVRVTNLKSNSLQGDRVYEAFFPKLAADCPTLDISDCPDLGPILFAVAAMKNGAVFTGTDRLRLKESDRGIAMHQELQKLGGGLIFGDNTITVPKQTLHYRNIPLDGHNDHRIVMALSVILSQTGGCINGAEAVKKSYPGFFDTIRHLGAKVELK